MRILFWFGCLSVPLFAQDIDVPDPALRDALIHGTYLSSSGDRHPIDANGDGTVTVAEAEMVDGTMDLSEKGIQDLSGLEAFRNASVLELSGNMIQHVELTEMKLVSIVLDNSEVESVTLTGMPRLETLNLDDNPLQVDEFEVDVPGLLSLSLTGCGLEALPSCVADFHELTHLWLGSNSITSITLTDVPELSYLVLDDNPLNLNECEIDARSLFELSCKRMGLESLPDWATNLERLTFLDLSSNSITSMTLTGVPELSSLVLDDNPLNPAECEIVAPTLSTLSIKRTGLHSLPSWISDFETLEGLYADGNPLESAGLSDLDSLIAFLCRDCQLTSIEELIAPNLLYIDLTRNQIVDLDLRGFPVLLNIGVDDNPIESVLFSQPNQVQYLSMTKSHLDTFDVAAVPNIKWLYISSSSGGLGLKAENLPQLEHLDAEGLNSISLSNLPSLRSIGIRDSTIDNLQVVGFPQLEQLSVSQNQIGTYTIANLPELEVLSLSDNEPFALSGGGTPQLQTMYASRCGLEVLDVSGFENLRHLDVSENQFEEQSNLVLPDSLDSLYLYKNNLTSFEAFDGLEVLRIYENRLDNLVLCDSLESLLAYDNNLTSLDIGYPNLTHIGVSGNPLTSIDLSAAGSLKRLTIGPTAMDHLDVSAAPNLQSIGLSGRGPEWVEFGQNSGIEGLYFSSLSQDTVICPSLPNLTRLTFRGCRFNWLELPSVPQLNTVTISFCDVANVDWLRDSPWLDQSGWKSVIVERNLLREDDCPALLEIRDRVDSLLYKDQGGGHQIPPWTEWPLTDVLTFVSGRDVEPYTLQCD